MSDKKIPLNPYAVKQYNLTGEVSVDVGVNYLEALIVLASADGDLAEAELKWLTDEQVMLGAPTELIEEIKKFDWKNADLDKLLAGISYDFPIDAKRTMIYQAIKMASADKDFHHQERSAIRKAAEKLQVPADVVHALEHLVEMEHAVDKLRFTLIGTSV
jgi:uncharacterized tellurite resistance protein B-like protein